MLSIRWDCTKSSYHFLSSFFPVHKRFPCTFQTCQSDWSVEIARNRRITFFLPFSLYIKGFPVHFKLVKAIDLLLVTVSWELISTTVEETDTPRNTKERSWLTNAWTFFEVVCLIFILPVPFFTTFLSQNKRFWPFRVADRLELLKKPNVISRTWKYS